MRFLVLISLKYRIFSLYLKFIIKEGIFMSIKRKGFTLAEILITLGIIGVVAAMTLPMLMTNIAKQRTLTKVRTFYSKINQAIQLSIADGNAPTASIQYKFYSYNDNLAYLKQFVYPYLKYVESYPCMDNYTVCTSLYDGGVMTFGIDGGGADIIYFINKNDVDKEQNLPHFRFAFQLAKIKSSSDNTKNANEYVEPYTFNWDLTKAGLKSGRYGCYKGCPICAYCTKLLQENNWKFSGDYPW